MCRARRLSPSAISYFLDCYLVDPASSHMLVSKIKPCIVSVLALTRRNREWLIKSVMVH